MNFGADIEMKLYSHVIKHDTGLAPNPFHGYCTSALCTPSHKNARLKKGDWLIGNSPRKDGNRLVYAMRISEVLSMNQYFHDGRFERKKPKPEGAPEEQCGDNIYYQDKEAQWRRLPSRFHDNPESLRQDPGHPVFVAEHFYYFGCRRVAIPDELAGVICGGIGIHDKSDLADGFVTWLEDSHQPGVLGKPRDMPDHARSRRDDHGLDGRWHSASEKPKTTRLSANCTIILGNSASQQRLPLRVALLRVGIDSGSGGMDGPLFADGTFEFVPIPDSNRLDERTYGNQLGRTGTPLSEFFLPARRNAMRSQSIHMDPEFASFTYGDPTSPKAGLRHLSAGDLLVFYAGLRGYGCDLPQGLYLIGYFEVAFAGLARDLTEEQVRACSNNFHVRHESIFREQRDRLVLVKGGPGSRLLTKAVKISVIGRDRTGKPLKVLSPEMQQIFGSFDGKLSFQRSPTRCVANGYVPGAASFVRGLA